jgi:hypothetical protein
MESLDIVFTEDALLLRLEFQFEETLYDDDHVWCGINLIFLSERWISRFDHLFSVPGGG